MEFRFTDPASDFSDGLAVLSAYHQSLLAQGKQLLLLADDIVAGEMQEALANRCIAMHCYYFHANRLHHLDEERGLFPLLLDGEQLIIGMMDLLVQDHQDIEEDWEALSRLLGSPRNITDAQEFQRLAAVFEKKQREHLLREEEDFLPRVATLLSAEQKAQAGASMVRLRNQKQVGLASA